MSEKKYLRRIAFKLSVKDKWLYTYWYGCNCNELPYGLKTFFDHLTSMFNEDTLLIKIERRLN